MIVSLNKKCLFTLYLSILRPCFVMSQGSMSSGSDFADKFSVAYVTVPSEEVGKTLGHGLVKNKLAACVNIVPQVTSIYEWKDEINEDKEALLMIKTRTSMMDKLTEYVRSNHPYEVCEVISLPIKNGNPPYLKWIVMMGRHGIPNLTTQFVVDILWETKNQTRKKFRVVFHDIP